MNKNISKFLATILMVTFLINIHTIVFAAGLASSFFPSEVTPTIITIDEGGKVTDMASKVLGAVQFVGFAIAIGMVLYAGIKYMMSAANDRAELKNATIRLVIGAVIVASASGVFPIMWRVFGSVVSK